MARDPSPLVTNLKILGIVVGTLALYTLIANSIPQVQSEVPEELTFEGDVTPGQLVAAGEELYGGAGGCTACHGLGTRAPNLLSGEGGEGPIGARCADRVEGEDCKTYLHRSLLEPGAYVVEGYNPIMPAAERTLSDVQIWSLVAFLQSVGGDVTVAADDLEVAAGEEAAAPPSGGGAVASASEPRALLDELGCMACHRLGEEGQEVGPPLDGLGSRRSPAEIRRSILEPDAEIAAGYESFAGVMPKNFGERMTAAQLETLVDFLAGR